MRSCEHEDMRKTAVLLDIDGTLIDSNDAHAHAWVETGREFGYDIAFDKVRWLIGMGGDKVLPELTGLKDDSEKGKKILERRGELFREKYISQLEAFDGAHDLLVRLRDDGYKLVVATSASEEDLDALLKQGGFEDVIKKATTSDDADESKPAPDIIEAALKKAGVEADQAFMLGDTPYDVSAASKAGVDAIAVRCGGWEEEELRGAVAIFDNPRDLLVHYSESPFGKK
jgi:HAD superfamily hydrolase (TIGR01549 family)